MSGQPKKSKNEAADKEKASRTSSPKLKWLSGKKRLAIILVVLIIIAALFVVLGHNTKKVHKPAPPSYAQLLSAVNRDLAKGKYQDAIDTLKKAPENKNNDLLLISIYQTKGDYKSALAEYNLVIKKYGSNLGLVEAAATAAEEAHDYKQAIYYYKQAKKIVSEEAPYATQQADENSYNAKIKALEAKSQ